MYLTQKSAPLPILHLNCRIIILYRAKKILQQVNFIICVNSDNDEEVENKENDKHLINKGKQVEKGTVNISFTYIQTGLK